MNKMTRLQENLKKLLSKIQDENQQEYLQKAYEYLCSGKRKTLKKKRVLKEKSCLEHTVFTTNGNIIGKSGDQVLSMTNLEDNICTGIHEKTGIQVIFHENSAGAISGGGGGHSASAASVEYAPKKLSFKSMILRRKKKKTVSPTTLN